MGKSGRVVIVTAGKYAGRKAVVVKEPTKVPKTDFTDTLWLPVSTDTREKSPNLWAKRRSSTRTALKTPPKNDPPRPTLSPPSKNDTRPAKTSGSSRNSDFKKILRSLFCKSSLMAL